MRAHSCTSSSPGSRSVISDAPAVVSAWLILASSLVVPRMGGSVYEGSLASLLAARRASVGRRFSARPADASSADATSRSPLTAWRKAGAAWIRRADAAAIDALRWHFYALAVLKSPRHGADATQ